LNKRKISVKKIAANLRRSIYVERRSVSLK
jgi:hypothetical protein